MCWDPRLSLTLVDFYCFKILALCFLLLFFAVRYLLNPLIKRNHFGHIGSANPNVLFSLRKTSLVFTWTNEECQARLTRGLLWLCEGSSRMGGLSLRTGVYSGSRYSFSKMLLMKMRKFCLTNIINSFVKSESAASSFPIWSRCFYCRICSLSLRRYMDWDLVKAQSGVAIGRISNRAAFHVGHSREILELLPGSMKQEFPTWETPKQAATFISKFMEVKGEFSQSDFRTPRWCTRRKPLGRRRWSALSSRSWRNHCSSAGCITPSGLCITDHSEPLSFLRNAREV